MDLSQAIKARAHDLGFDLVAITPAAPSPDYDRYQRWLEAGYAGEMAYLARHAPLKTDPRSLLPDAQSLVLVGLNYHQSIAPSLRSDPGRGQIAAYALGHDYHDIMRKALIELDGWLRSETGRNSRGRVFVDSAPVLERSWGMRAGLGFIAKNTCLISPEMGSWFFIGGLLAPEQLEYDAPPVEIKRLKAKGKGQKSPIYWQFSNGRTGSCGACTRCLDVCPTAALVSPHELDARLCISYLTIELRGEIPIELRSKLGNWVFGCDLCQDVCPWNRAAETSVHPSLRPHPDRLAPPLVDLLALDHSSFNQRFRISSVKRAKWEGFMRNVCVAAGNWGEPAALAGLRRHLFESPPLVAKHAAWALGQLAGNVGLLTLRRAHETIAEPQVKFSIETALNES
ncbi:MAG: DUF1730 domain-containing protein [Proteobacteria bacterium]|nr:DUF1730 domain-containing protein [Pseudomonadota bacterium]